MSIRVFLVDDDELVRSTLRVYFQTTEDITMVGEATNGADCLDQLEEAKPDLVLADIHMPHMDGITLLKHLNSAPNPPTFLAVTAFDSDDTMLKILRAGGAGYILKNQRPRSIIEAVRAAVEGGTVVAPAAMHRLVDYIGEPATPRDPVAAAIESHELHDAEIAVLKLLLAGNSNSEIAAATHYSESAVKKHVSRLITIFGASTRLNLVAKILGGAGS